MNDDKLLQAQRLWRDIEILSKFILRCTGEFNLRPRRFGFRVRKIRTSLVLGETVSTEYTEIIIPQELGDAVVDLAVKLYEKKKKEFEEL